MLLKGIVHLLNVVLEHLSYSVSNLLACSIYTYTYSISSISLNFFPVDPILEHQLKIGLAAVLKRYG